ncbi:MAG: hypothetical protein AAFV85_18840 [Cyanobacteria bacterium J06634_6]
MQQDNHYLIDILHAAERIQEYTAERTLTDFYDDVTLQDKVMRRLLALSKTAQRISAATREEISEIADARISIVKERPGKVAPFSGVDQVWKIAKLEIPFLIQTLNRLFSKESLSPEDEQQSHFSLHSFSGH